MELDSRYGTPAFFGLETSVIDDYRAGIRKLRESKEPQEQLAILHGMFKSLGESHPGSDRVSWIRDVILMYRNLGKILGKISGGLQVSQITSKYADLLSNYRDTGETDTENIENAFEDLNEINKVLKKHNINVGDADELDERLKEVTELEERISSLGYL